MQFCPNCSDGRSGRLATRAGGVCDICYQEGKGEYVEPTEFIRHGAQMDHYAPSMREGIATDRHGNVREDSRGRAVRQAMANNRPGPSGGFPTNPSPNSFE